MTALIAPNSFRLELFQAIHDFDNDTLKMALYSAGALSKSTTAYSTTNEISGTGYSAGGATCSISSGYPQLINDRAVTRFDAVTWSPASFSAGMALIYNSSKSNRAVMIVDFGGTYTAAGTSFTVELPLSSAPMTQL